MKTLFAVILFTLICATTHAEWTHDSPVFLDQTVTNQGNTPSPATHWATVKNNKIFFTPDRTYYFADRFVEVFADSSALSSLAAASDTLRARLHGPQGVRIDSLVRRSGWKWKETTAGHVHLHPDGRGFSVSSFHWVFNKGNPERYRHPGPIAIIVLSELTDDLPDSTAITLEIDGIGESQPLPLIKYYLPRLYWERDTTYIAERGARGQTSVKVNLYGKNLTHGGTIYERETRHGETHNILRVKDDRVVNYFELVLEGQGGTYMSNTGLGNISVTVPDSSVFSGVTPAEERRKFRDRKYEVRWLTFGPIRSADGLIATFEFELIDGFGGDRTSPWGTAGWVWVKGGGVVGDCFNNDCLRSRSSFTRPVVTKNGMRHTFLNRPPPTQAHKAIDFNADGMVNFADFLSFSRYFDRRDMRADLDRNGRVEFDDFLWFVRFWNESQNA